MDITETNLTVPEDIGSIRAIMNSGVVSMDKGYGLSDCCATISGVKTVDGTAMLHLPLPPDEYDNRTGKSHNEIISESMRCLKESVAYEIALKLLQTDAIDFAEPSTIVHQGNLNSITIEMSGTVKVLKN